MSMVMVPTPHSALGICFASAAGTAHWYTALLSVLLASFSDALPSVPEALPKA